MKLAPESSKRSVRPFIEVGSSSNSGAAQLLSGAAL